MAITAKMVADLRKATGLGMMECKKALVETDGDAKKAEEVLRIRSGAKASKVAGRTAAEGVIIIKVSDDGKNAIIADVSCETDFVAKDEGFLSFANVMTNALLTNDVKEVADLANIQVGEKTAEETRKDIVAKLGENISVRRFHKETTTGVFAQYLHGKKIGVLVNISKDADLGKDVAMHIAASKPICVSADNVPAEKIAEEKNIYTQQAANSGKPANIVEKMVEGRIRKFLAEITLVGQPFVKNPDQTVEQLLKSHNATVNSFTMYIVGEGIEKKEMDFAAEVAAVSNA